MNRAKPNRYIALLRGINIGGRNKLPMQPLRDSITELGFENVRSYIQSGNLILDAPRRMKPHRVANRLAQMLTEKGFPNVPVLVLPLQDLQRIFENLPFDDPDVDPKSVHFFFCLHPDAKPDIETARLALDDSERLEGGNAVIYLHAPNGIARSKVVAKMDQLSGSPMTSRNLRTVETLLALADD